MSATEEVPFHLNSVPDHLALAVLAYRSHPLNRTLKAIEGMRYIIHNHSKGFVVFITTYFTLCHLFYTPSFVSFVLYVATSIPMDSQYSYLKFTVAYKRSDV